MPRRSTTLSFALVGLFLLASLGCEKKATVQGSGRNYNACKLTFDSIKTVSQASAFFGSTPVDQQGESVTWQVQPGLTMTFQIGEEGFRKVGNETNPTPVFEPAIQSSDQAKLAFGRDPDRTVTNSSLEMSIESYEVAEYDVSFGFKSDGTTTVLIGGTAAAKTAVDQVPVATAAE